MTSPLVCAPARRGALVLGAALSLACAIPNPEFDANRSDLDETAGDGDGDGDGDATGDGDGDPSTGDGDGDTSTTGDGDGDDTTTGDGDGDPIVCDDGKQECDGACVDTNVSWQYCGSCDNSCAGATVCGNGECLAKRYVFVTSLSFPGNFGGAVEATGICTELAMDAGLEGEFVAWVSDDFHTPAEALVSSSAALVLRGGEAPIVAYSWEDFVDGKVERPINRDEHGVLIEPSPVANCDITHAVWTGTTNQGYPSATHCDSWNPNENQGQGVVGNSNSLDGWSDSSCEASCLLELPIYCVQQG